MTHEDYRELLVAKALTALDAADNRALSEHLESCADCRSEMTEWEETAALLAFAAKPLEPSGQVRDRILGTVRAEGNMARPDGDRATTAGVHKSKVLPFAAPQRTAWVPFRSFGAIAAAVVFVALGIALVVLWQNNRTTQNELARLNREIVQTRAERDREHALAELLTSPEAHMAKLSGTNVAPGAHAMLAYDKDGHAMLMAKGLPAAPAGMAYQLWFIKDNKKMPGKVFSTDAAGNGMLEDQVPEVAREAAVFAITLEPQSGVQVPTGSIYLVSS